MSQTLPPPPPLTSPGPPSGPEGADSSYAKFRNEVLAGGASEQPDVDDTAGGTRAVLGIGVIVALLGLLAVWNAWAFLFVVLLLGCIFLHEVGHFVTAKWTGMKATQFFLFMGPKLWSFRRGETEYGIRAYPIGAFVRIIGMNNLDEVAPEDEPRAYRNQSYPKRMLVICAGSIMHMIIAMTLLFGVYSTKGVLEPTGRVAVSEVVAAGPAAEAGLRAEDVVLSIGGVTPTTGEEYVALVQARSPGDMVPFVIDRDGEVLTIDVGLGANPNQGPDFGKAYVGTRSGGENDWQSMSVPEAAGRSITDLGNGMWQSVGGVVKVLNPVNIFQHLAGTAEDPSTQPTTVVGVSRFSGIVGDDTGLAGILILLAGVNVFVGLLNLFPMLPFDGGHAAVATYERLRSRKGAAPYRADVGKLIPVAMTMMGLLLFLMLAGLYLDIVKPIGG